MENVDELLSKVVAYESEHEEATLSGFLEEVALVADIDNVDEEQDRVLLMTLHSAKGLEFSHVYLAGMEDGIFPSYMTITADDSSELEEERRLAYVGITRAKKDLTITAAKKPAQKNDLTTVLNSQPLFRLLDRHRAQLFAELGIAKEQQELQGHTVGRVTVIPVFL